jgi:hypothetical protein
MVLHGALALFTFNSNGSDIKCNILHNIHGSTNIVSIVPIQQVMIIEKQQWHGLTAAPTTLGYPGQAIVFETNGRMFDPTTTSKVFCNIIPTQYSLLLQEYVVLMQIIIAYMYVVLMHI